MSATTTEQPAESMSKSVAKGAAWSTIANIARIASSLLVLPILARYLEPAEFGIMQMGMPVVIFLLMFNDFGFGPALVRAKTLTKNAWRSVFWINLMIGIAMTAALYFAAGPIANWFEQPDAKPIFEALSYLIVMNCLIITPAADLQRRMQFKILSMIEVVAISGSIVVAIIAAMNGYGAWSLVAQQVVLFSTKTILMWVFSRPPIAPIIVASEIKALLGFSSNMMATRVVNFLARNADNLIIGKILGAAALGFYSIAYRILLLPVEIFAWGLSQVLLPAVSKFQDDLPRIRSATLRTYRLISAFTFPTMTGIALLADPIINVFLGERMAPAASVLQILAPIGAIQSLSSSQGAMFMALGRADILFRLSALTMVTCIIGYLIGVRWGLTGVAFSYLISIVILTPYMFTRLLKLIGLDVSSVLKAIKTPTYASLFMGVGVYALLHHTEISTYDYVRQLLILVPIGALLYAAYVAIAERSIITEILGIAKDVSSR